jgi:hypothetical protein
MRKRSETGPARRRRAPARASNVARSRTRQIRPRDACGHARDERGGRRGHPWCASEAESRASWRACDCWAGTCASRKSPLEEVAPGPKWGTVRAAETTQCTAPIRRGATRSGGDSESGENLHVPLSHKDTGATLRASLGRRCAVQVVPVCHSTTPAEPVEHIWVISTPVEPPVENIGGGRQDHPQWS